MNENELLKKIAIAKAKPDTLTDISPRDLADLVLVVLQYAKEINKQIVEGKIKGDKGADGADAYNPVPDVDYLSLPTAKAEIDQLKEQLTARIALEAQNALSKLRNGKDGKDAQVTEKHLKMAAEMACDLIELPDFRKYITEQPEAIRDSLELLQDDERLDVSAIKGLDELLKKYEGKKEMVVGGIRFLSQLVDVYTTSLANNDVLKWNSTTLRWENGAGGGSVALDDVTDVTITAVADNEVLAYDSGSSTWINQTAAEAGLAPALGADDNYVTDAEKVKLSNLSGTNTGDQTSIVGITGTKAQFDTAVTDGNFLYVGDVTSNATHTGDATGDTALTLATVNSNVGSFTNANITVNAKGLVTAASSGVGGSGGIVRSITITSGNVTAGASATTDYVYLVAGLHTITLPTAVSNTNRYTIKNNHSAAITVDTTSSQTIDGTTSIQIAPEDAVDIISTNTNWSVI